MENSQLLFDWQRRVGDTKGVRPLIERIRTRIRKEGAAPGWRANITEKESGQIINCQNDGALIDIIGLTRGRVGDRNGAETRMLWWAECVNRLAPGAIWSPALDQMVRTGWIYSQQIEEFNKTAGRPYLLESPSKIFEMLEPWIENLTSEEVLRATRMLGSQAGGIMATLIGKTKALTRTMIEEASADTELMGILAKRNIHLDDESAKVIWECVAKKMAELLKNQKNPATVNQLERQKEQAAIRAATTHLIARGFGPPAQVEKEMLGWARTKEAGPGKRGVSKAEEEARAQWVRDRARVIVLAPILPRTDKEMSNILEAAFDMDTLIRLAERKDLSLYMAEKIAGVEWDGWRKNRHINQYINQYIYEEDLERLVILLATKERLKQSQLIREMAGQQTGPGAIREIFGRLPWAERGDIVRAWTNRMPKEMVKWMSKMEDEKLAGIPYQAVAGALVAPEREARVKAVALGAKIARVAKRGEGR